MKIWNMLSRNAPNQVENFCSENFSGREIPEASWYRHCYFIFLND